VAYYQWVRARSVIDVAKAALKDQQAHLADVATLRAAGMATEADVLQREAAVASAELQLASTERLATLAEAQLRLIIGANADERLLIGERLDVATPESATAELPQRATPSRRCELAALTAASQAEQRAATAEAAAGLPSLVLLGQALYANPNPRYVPPEEKWLGTWAVGAQLTWSPNDWFTGAAAARGAEARAAEHEARRREVEQAITLEITDASTELSTARTALKTADRQLAAASRALENAREAFRAGRFTSTALSDIETEVTRARLARLNARADYRIARVRLAAALGAGGGC
jgi:outer membrane protein TolC